MDTCKDNCLTKLNAQIYSKHDPPLCETTLCPFAIFIDVFHSALPSCLTFLTTHSCYIDTSLQNVQNLIQKALLRDYDYHPHERLCILPTLCCQSSWHDSIILGLQLSNWCQLVILFQCNDLGTVYFPVFTYRNLCFQLFVFVLSLLAFSALALAFQLFTCKQCLHISLKSVSYF